MAQYGIIIRADGTVPFDTEVDDGHKQAMLGHLVAAGLTVQKQPDGSYKIPDWKPPEA